MKGDRLAAAHGAGLRQHPGQQRRGEIDKSLLLIHFSFHDRSGPLGKEGPAKKAPKGQKKASAARDGSKTAKVLELLKLSPWLDHRSYSTTSEEPPLSIFNSYWDIPCRLSA